MNYWLIIRLPILFAIGVSGGVGVARGVLGRTGEVCRDKASGHPPVCSAGELPHLCPGHLHRGVQAESQPHVQDGHQVQVRDRRLCRAPSAFLPAETDPGCPA